MINKQKLKQSIESAFNHFEGAIQKHPDINQKRADGGWSVGEIGDHIVKGTQDNFGDTEKTDRPYDKNAASIKETFLNFNLKFPAAPFLQPEAKQYSVQDLLDSLERRKNSLLRMIDEEDLIVTCIDISLPVWGKLTKYEWLVLIENHIIRHTKQVEDFNKITNQR